MKFSQITYVAICRADFWSFINEIVTRNPNLGRPALEDGLFVNLLIFNFVSRFWGTLEDIYIYIYQYMYIIQIIENPQIHKKSILQSWYTHRWISRDKFNNKRLKIIPGDDLMAKLGKFHQ